MKLPATAKKPLSSTQRTLDKFFTMSSPSSSSSRQETPPPQRRSPSKRKNEEEENVVVQITPKRSKTDEEKEKPVAATSSPSILLTPEQKKSIADKQIAARLKLVSATFPLIDPTSVGSTWFREILEAEFKKPYFKQLNDFYGSLRTTVYPKKENIFSWTRYCSLRDVKVVIIGQDPYHGPNQAHGLCFSVQKGVASPPSLLNMYKELVSDPEVPGFDKVPSHGCLEGWARQGVLLLNAVLTVEQGRANSHKEKGWENLTTAVIKWISSNLRDVVFLLWGSHAQKMGSVVDKKRHTVLSTVHPSPLSAHRGFFGCRHFSKCNEILIKNGKEGIRWEELP